MIVNTAQGTIASQTRVRANGHVGTVNAVTRARKGTVVFIEWDDLDVAVAAQRHGICWTTNPHKAHHRNVDALEILN